MKYVIVLGTMSAALAFLALLYPIIALLLIWASLSFGLVAAGYAGIGVRVFGKRPDGRIPIFLKILLFPYLTYTWLIWHLLRRLTKEDAFNQIDERIVVGRRLLASEVPEEFDHYVDLTAEFDEPSGIRADESYRSFPILDASIPTRRELDAAVEVASEGNVYIHCAQGHGRTGLFALALMFRRGQIKNAVEGLQVLQNLRPAINLNSEQQGFIECYLSQKAEQCAPCKNDSRVGDS